MIQIFIWIPKWQLTLIELAKTISLDWVTIHYVVFADPLSPQWHILPTITRKCFGGSFFFLETYMRKQKQTLKQEFFFFLITRLYLDFMRFWWKYEKEKWKFWKFVGFHLIFIIFYFPFPFSSTLLDPNRAKEILGKLDRNLSLSPISLFYVSQAFMHDGS